MTRDELIAALEAVDGPSRELDAEITGYIWPDAKILTNGWYELPNRRARLSPLFTAIIDASETLRLPGYSIIVCEEAGAFTVEIEDDAGASFVGRHKIEAIARCIAWLKARKQ